MQEEQTVFLCVVSVSFLCLQLTAYLKTRFMRTQSFYAPHVRLLI